LLAYAALLQLHLPLAAHLVTSAMPAALQPQCQHQVVVVVAVALR
jgi:hypothetical protein